MKKQLAVLTFIFAFLLSCYGSASNMQEPVEISFKVGDSTLNINGEDVTVETPYVVGEGVTLVPVRVITEAFGAAVDWDGTERKVTLTTEEKKIELWIGRIDAEMNGETLTLLSAPEILNNVTMVPLRFISEGFGAVVSYDSQTKGIRIVKEPEIETKEETYYYKSSDESFSAHVPNEFFMGEDKNGFYEFVTNLKYNNSVSSVVFSVNALDDVEETAEEDRVSQLENVTSERIKVTGITQGKMNGIDVWYYQLVDEKKNVLVTKVFFDHGSMSYALLNYVTALEYDVRDDENLNLAFGKYDITVPSVFQGKELYRNTEIPASNDIESIGVRVFKSINDADVEGFLRNSALVFSTKENTREYVENKIGKCDYTVMDEKVSAYEYTMTGTGIVTKGIAFELNDHIVVMKLMTTLSDDDVRYFVENLVFDFDKMEAPEFENAKTLEDIGDNSVKVKTGGVSFNVPETFEVTFSKDKKLIIANDNESDVTLMCFVNADTIDNDDEEETMVPSAYYGMVEGKTKKRTVSETMSQTRDFLDTYLWDSVSSTRRAFSGVDLPKNGTDSAKFVKLMLNSTWSYLNLYQVRESDKLMEDVQRIHAFVFSYTSEYHTYGTMLKLESIMRSVDC